MPANTAPTEAPINAITKKILCWSTTDGAIVGTSEGLCVGVYEGFLVAALAVIESTTTVKDMLDCTAEARLVFNVEATESA